MTGTANHVLHKYACVCVRVHRNKRWVHHSHGIGLLLLLLLPVPLQNPNQDVVIDPIRGPVKYDSDTPGHKVQMRTAGHVSKRVRDDVW